MFCNNCGNEANDKAVVCVKCGVSLAKSIEPEGDDAPKDWLTTLLLNIFLGVLGIHRFYTGHTGIGVVQLLTFGGCGIWAFVDFIVLVTGKFKDANGRLLRKK